MKICEVLDCNNKAEYEDPMHNFICEEHMIQEVNEDTYDYEDYQRIS